MVLEPLGHLQDRDGPLGRQSPLGNPPSLVLGTDAVFDRHDHVVEEDLIEVGRAPGLLDRAHFNAHRMHVDHQAADALVLGRRGIGAGEQHAPVGLTGPAGPDFLTIDDVAFPVPLSPRLQTGQVGTGIGFGIPLAPHFARADRRQEALPLFGGGVVEQGWRHVEHGDVEQRVARHIPARQFLGDHHLFLDAEPATPLLGPVRRQ